MTIVFVETDAAGQVTLTSAEAITFARTQLLPDGGAATSREVSGPPSGSPEAVVIGELSDAAVEELGRLGVSIIHHLEHPDLAEYSAAAWAQAIVDVTPEAGTLLASGTPRGMELMAHAAVRTGARMAANVVAADEEGLLRQVHGGTAFERLRLDGDLQVLTLAGHACTPEETTPTTPEIYDYELTVAEADLAKIGRAHV